MCKIGDISVRSFHCSLVTFLKTLMITVSSPFLPADILPASRQTVSIAVGVNQIFLLLFVSWQLILFILYITVHCI